jgi:deoxyribodipyrimidine photo-lyase
MSAGLMWFRRDLRLHDNTAFYHALRECDPVYCCFCFDREILDPLVDRADRRVAFIHQSLTEMAAALKKRGTHLIVRHGRAREEIPRLAAGLKVSTVYANHDYEPTCNERDRHVRRTLEDQGRQLKTFKDHVVFEKDEIVNRSGGPFRVYTPYRNAWRAALTRDHYSAHRCERYWARLAAPPKGLRSHPWRLGDLGFGKTDLQWPGGTRAGRKMLRQFLTKAKRYPKTRDYPAMEGTSRLSVHLRFGTLSIREPLRATIGEKAKGVQAWVDQLIWREFYNMILHHFPHTEVAAFQPRLDALPWRHDKKAFEAWCLGVTGYPIVDAGMRQLNTTGYMHNRLRMITASFLTKDLLIDWKWGERYFARKLLDYDLSQNLGGWQWTASIGTDAAPYFRVFNPWSQSRRFDPDGAFIRKYCPELADLPDRFVHEPFRLPPLERARLDYPEPIVDHGQARLRVLEVFGALARDQGKKNRRGGKPRA